jgi:hypothetical protein
MTALLVAALALVVGSQSEPVAAGHASASPQELRSSIRTALAAEATAATRDERLLAVSDIVRLYGDLKSNSKMAQSERLRLRAKLRSRLRRVTSDLQRELPKSNATGHPVIGAKATGADGGQAVEDPAAKLIEIIESTIRPDSWAARGGAGVIAGRGGGVAGAGAGGGVGGFGGGIHGGGLGRARAEQAEHLIDLIQKTIRPESWEINGGRGTIMYWPGS